jgi:hypothetical protein
VGGLSQIQVWRLSDDGLDQVYRAANPLQLSPQALGSSGSLLTLKSRDGFKRVIDASGKRLPELACRWIERTLTADEQLATLGSRLRRPFSCPARAR